jgi:hypothetical protein
MRGSALRSPLQDQHSHGGSSRRPVKVVLQKPLRLEVAVFVLRPILSPAGSFRSLGSPVDRDPPRGDLKSSPRRTAVLKPSELNPRRTGRTSIIVWVYEDGEPVGRLLPNCMRLPR